jgi:hypothetical protein
LATIFGFEAGISVAGHVESGTSMIRRYNSVMRRAV